MRKFRLLGLALFAVFAFSAAVAASSAFALESVWLVNGAKPPTTELVLSETLGVNGDNSGSILLEDKGNLIVPKVDILCSFLNEGWVGPGSLDEVTLIMSLGTTETAEGWIACTVDEGCEAGTTVEIRPIGLPWVTELLLVEGKFLDDIMTLGGTAGEEAGWEVRNCLAGGIKTMDKCTTNAASVDIDNTTESDVIALFLGPPPAGVEATCTATHEKTGVVEGEVLIFTESGLSLAVSEG